MDQLPSHPGRTSVKASHTDQLDLLELQKLDQKESALRHKRDSHPAHATVREFAGRVADLQRAAISQSAVIADTMREVTRIEDEIAKVSERRKRQQSRIDNNQVPLRDISAMEHEIAQMDRRLAKLEDDQVEAEERVEAARGAQDQMKAEAQAIAADIEALKAQFEADVADSDAASSPRVASSRSACPPPWSRNTRMLAAATALSPSSRSATATESVSPPT